MTVWGWFFSAALVVAAIGVALAITGIGRRKTRRLRERFGPEYEPDEHVEADEAKTKPKEPQALPSVSRLAG